MVRILVLVAVIITALVFSLNHFTSTIEEKRSVEDQILDGNDKNLRMRGGAARPIYRPPEGRPTTEDDELLRLDFAGPAKEFPVGGPTRLSLRGNHAVFRRPDPTQPHWKRSVVGGPELDALLAQALELPAVSGEGAQLRVWSAPGKMQVRTVGGEALEAFLAALPEDGKSHLPREFALHFVPATDEEGTEDWPAGLPAPGHEGAETITFRPPGESAVRALLKQLKPGTVYRSAGGARRLVSYVAAPR